MPTAIIKTEPGWLCKVKFCSWQWGVFPSYSRRLTEGLPENLPNTPPPPPQFFFALFAINLKWVYNIFMGGRCRAQI